MSHLVRTLMLVIGTVVAAGRLAAAAPGMTPAEEEQLKKANAQADDENLPNRVAIASFEAFLKEHPDTPFKASLYMRIGCLYGCNVKDKFPEEHDRRKETEYLEKAHAIWGREFNSGNITAWHSLINFSKDPKKKIEFYAWLRDLRNANASTVYPTRDYGQALGGHPVEWSAQDREQIIKFYLSSGNASMELSVARSNIVNSLKENSAGLRAVIETFPDDDIAIEARKALAALGTPPTATAPAAPK